MGDYQRHYQQAGAAAAAAGTTTTTTTTSSSPRLGIRGGGGGEIVEVQGGHIVRSTGRKDRHSKVCTAKGPRDRRVRLSAHTAIQFYDVQDRLGYDRPSKAVDWLIKKAKAAINELAELPAWKPTATAPAAATTRRKQQQGNVEKQDKDVTKATTAINTTTTSNSPNDNNDNSNSIRQISFLHSVVDLDSGNNNTSSGSFRKHQELLFGMRDLQGGTTNNNDNSNPSFLPPSLDSDSIADTIKSFFPMGGASADAPSSSVQFPNYPPDLLSRTSSHSQDLRLSLQSFQDPMLLHHHHHQQQQEPPPVVFPGTGLGFDVTSAANAVWSSDHHSSPADIGRFHRLPAWSNPGGSSSTGGGGGGGGCGDGGGSGAFMFATPLPPTTILQPFFGGQSQSFSQRGPLQSSNIPSIRAWIDPTTTASDHQIPQGIHIHPSAASSGIGFASGSGFMGYHIPARIQGHEVVEHDGILNKPSSTSPNSRH